MRINSNAFSYNKQSKTFVAEMSDLGRFGFERLYQDACDLGFTMVSAVTNSEATFYMAEKKKDGEGDMLVWILKPTVESLRKYPVLHGTEVHILND